MKILPTEFDGQSIRRVYDEATETWWFSVIDVVQVLTDSENARDYWFKMKLRVKQEDGAQRSTFCRPLKLPAADGKQRLTAPHRCCYRRKSASHHPVRPQPQSRAHQALARQGGFARQ